MELVQSGQALLWDWQRTHDATDAANDAETMLHMLITTYPLGMEDLGALRNLLEGAAWRSWWGCTLTRRGRRRSSRSTRRRHPSREGGSQRSKTALAPPAAVSLVEEDARGATQKALKGARRLDQEPVEIVDDEGESAEEGRPEPREHLPSQRGETGRPEGGKQ